MKKVMLTTALLAAGSIGAAFGAEAAPVKTDEAHLDIVGLYVTAPGTFETFYASTVKKLGLPEGSCLLGYNPATSPLASVSFSVGSSGLIDFDCVQDPYVYGRGTDTLVTHGLAVSLDVTALDVHLGGDRHD